MHIKNKVTIILPIYNPIIEWDSLLNNSLKELFYLFKEIPFKIIIVNDGSSINFSTEKIYQLNRMYQNIEFVTYNDNKGKGYAIRKGLEKADSEYYIYSDWDFPFGERAVYEVYKVLINTDAVIGVRNNNYYNRLPFFRKIMSLSLRCVNFLFLGFKNIDTQAGLKGLSQEAKAIFLTTKTNSFIFELEFIKKMVHKNKDLKLLKVFPREDIHFTNFSTKIIVSELLNYFKIVLK